MTFSTKVKNELCKNSYPFCENSIKILYGFLLFLKNFKISEITFYTENKNIAKLIYDLIIQNFELNTLDSISLKENEKNIVLKLLGVKNIKQILKNPKINNNLLKNQNDIKLFLRGVFLSCGNISEPKNGYHLEFSMSCKGLYNHLINIFNEIKTLDVKIKKTVRNGNLIIYIKDSSCITDFLTFIGASNSSMELIQIKMVKEVRNYVNRTTNFETANINKTATAAAKQIKVIKRLKNEGDFKYLDEDLKELANLRIKNPEMSFRELGEKLSTPLSRSAVNYKIKKILNFNKNI